MTELINGYEVKGIENLIWFLDRDAILTGLVDFKMLKLEAPSKVKVINC